MVYMWININLPERHRARSKNRKALYIYRVSLDIFENTFLKGGDKIGQILASKYSCVSKIKRKVVIINEKGTYLFSRAFNN